MLLSGMWVDFISRANLAPITVSLNVQLSIKDRRNPGDEIAQWREMPK